MNIWVIILVSIILYTSCYCVKKEFFEEPNVENITKKPTGIKYNIVDVDKAVDLIKKYFVEKENAYISITKIISIINSSNEMTLKLFIYNPVKNFISGYEIKVKRSINKNEKGNILSVKKFTDKQEDIEYSEKVDYEKINFKDGQFIK